MKANRHNNANQHSATGPPTRLEQVFSRHLPSRMPDAPKVLELAHALKRWFFSMQSSTSSGSMTPTQKPVMERPDFSGGIILTCILGCQSDLEEVVATKTPYRATARPFTFPIIPLGVTYCD